MTNRKAVTISITPGEYDSICTAFGEYFDKVTGATDLEYVEESNKDGANFASFQKKYKRACQRQRVKKVVKEAIAYAKRNNHD